MAADPSFGHNAAMAITVRSALSEDAERLGSIHVRAWQTAYRGIMLDGFLDGLDAASRSDYWRASLSGRSSDGQVDAEWPTGLLAVLVALLDGDVVAMASVGGNRSPDEESSPSGELWMLNADPAVWGSGVAAVLLAEALAVLAQEGHSGAVLWVVEQNHRARRFYEREGWTADGGSKSEEIGGVEIVECRYYRQLR